MANDVKKTETAKWPEIFNRYIGECDHKRNGTPRTTVRCFHGREVPVWYGYVHVDDIEGYVENLRLRYYLNRWAKQQGSADARPTSDQIYEIMHTADLEERRDSKRPFQIERIADNIVRNGVREPLILYYTGESTADLWDGNRRFYGVKHIMKVDKESYKKARPTAQWLPAYVFLSTGDLDQEKLIKHDILVECNFVDPEQIPWPNYVKAEQIYNDYQKGMATDPGDPILSRETKIWLAENYGVDGWRKVDRWIKMYDLILQYKEYQEEENERDSSEVDLFVQSKFEYFDELSKPAVFGILRDDPDKRDKVFDWLWDGKFYSWEAVRKIPKIFADPEALKQAEEPSEDSVKNAIETVIANDPGRMKGTAAANQRIKQFSAWLNLFKREDYKALEPEAVETLEQILRDVVKITKALVTKGNESKDTAKEVK